jgi:hypothetical protein
MRAFHDTASGFGIASNSDIVVVMFTEREYAVGNEHGVPRDGISAGHLVERPPGIDSACSSRRRVPNEPGRKHARVHDATCGAAAEGRWAHSLKRWANMELARAAKETFP